jgi:hypothetical protein
MQPRRLQLVFAWAALLLLPWPALRPFDVALTFGDMALIPAILLNLDRIQRIHGWQIPMLLALPLILVSQATDADASIIEVGQAAYIFGIVLPFGWVAFADFRPRNLVYGVLISMGISSLVAGLQLTGVLDAVGRSSIWTVFGATRSAGLNISCSGLCMAISPMFALLLYVPSHRWRLGLLGVLLLGLVATLAKSAIFASIGLLFYLTREPNRRGIVTLGTVLVLLITSVFVLSPQLQETVDVVTTTVSVRIDRADISLWERTSTLRYAMEYVPECWFTGLGYMGTSRELTQHLGNTVHIFHLGIVLVGGLPAAMLHYVGVILLVSALYRSGHYPSAMMIICHMLALCTMTVLMLSFQYVPFLVAGAILNWQFALTNQNQPVGQPLHHRATSPLTGMPANQATA